MVPLCTAGILPSFTSRASIAIRLRLCSRARSRMVMPESNALLSRTALPCLIGIFQNPNGVIERAYRVWILVRAGGRKRLARAGVDAVGQNFKNAQCFVVFHKSSSSQCLAVADHSHAEALDGKEVALEIHQNRLEVGVLGQQLHLIALTLEALNRDFVAEPRYHDLARARFRRAMHSQQISIQDAD